LEYPYLRMPQPEIKRERKNSVSYNAINLLHHNNKCSILVLIWKSMESRKKFINWLDKQL